MKKLLIALGLVSAINANAQSISIAAARQMSIGQTVTVSGVVTNGGELGVIRYLQDGTAGIAAYGGNVDNINVGDSITVTGPLTEFNGLLEIGTGQAGGIPTYVNHGPAVVPAQPLTAPISAINESLEGQLVMINNLTFSTTGSYPANGNVIATNGTENIQVRINTNTNIDGTAIPTNTVSIVGIVSQFNADYQLIPRSLSDITSYVAPVREINVLINGITRLSGSTIALGSATTANLTIENLGTGNLTISNIAFTGAQSAAYSTTATTGVLAGNTANNKTITITPTTNGSYNATLTITSDDEDEAQYVLHFEGAGLDGFATEPANGPTNLTFPTNLAYKIDGQFTGTTEGTKYIVLWSNGAPVNGIPQDGTSYLRGDQIGNAKVAYVGNSTTFSPRGVIATQNYHFAIYAFNGSNGIENYNTASPLVGNVTSGGKNVGNYYSGINTSNTTFVTDLTAKINPHTYITYYNYLQTMMNNFALRDTANGQSYAECRYSGFKQVVPGTFTWNDANFSREHVYAHSWMPGQPYNSPEKPVYTDQHNLFPVRMPNVNAVRSNYPFGNVINQDNFYMGCKRGTDAQGKIVYEPRDEVKGDVARALMYMAVSYNNTGTFNWGFRDTISIWTIPYGQNIDVIRQWHEQDPPDAFEIARNEYIYSIQGNRNPFIDSVELACFINFKNMSYVAHGCGTASIENAVAAENVTIFPVPAKNELNVSVDNATIIAVELIDLQGRVIETISGKATGLTTMNVQEINAGTYLLSIRTDKGSIAQKVIIE